MHWKGREFALVCVLTVSAPKSRIAMQHMVCFRTSYGIKSRQRTIGIRRWNLDRYRLHLTAVQTNCDQQPSSTNNCLDNTELLPKQQEHSCPDQWSYMLAEQLCPLSNLERSLCHNEIWSSSCNAKCCFACEMPVLISLFEESEFLNHEEENTTYNWVFFQLRNGGCWNLFPSAWQGSWIDFKMRNSWQLGQCNEWSEHTNDDDSEKASLWITLNHCKFYSGFNCSEEGENYDYDSAIFNHTYQTHQRHQWMGKRKRKWMFEH